MKAMSVTVRCAGTLLCSLVLWASFDGDCLAANSGRELRVYNWVDYLPKSVLEDFQLRTGIRVTYDVYDTGEILEAKLLAGNSGYDVVFPSHNQLPRLIQAGALEPLDKARLPNWSHLDQSFLAELARLDPGNRYAAPYLWGTTTIGYNVNAVQKILGPDFAATESWDWVFKQENLSRLSACGVAFPDSGAEVYALALNYLGLNPASTTADDYLKAQQLLMRLRPSIKYFHSSRYVTDLASADICVAVGYSGGLMLARATADAAHNGVQIELASPREGALMWADNMAIAQGARNRPEAEEFINYILEPRVIANVSTEIGYPNLNADFSQYVDPRVISQKGLLISAHERRGLFLQQPMPPDIERLITRLWMGLRNGK